MAEETAERTEVVLRSARPRVGIGTRVEVELIGEDGSLEQMAFDIVPDAQADMAHGFLAAGAGLARALLGQPVGAVISYAQDDVAAVHIVAVEPSQRAPASDLAATRAAAVQRAISQAHLEDAVRLALTVDVKWGDYDPEGLESGWDRPA